MTTTPATDPRYAKVVEVSKRVRWEIERDVFRGRRFDFTRTFLPSGLSLVGELPFLSTDHKRLLSQVQGRTYAYIFGLVERFIGAKVLEISREHWLGDQVAQQIDRRDPFGRGLDHRRRRDVDAPRDLRLFFGRRVGLRHAQHAQPIRRLGGLLGGLFGFFDRHPQPGRQIDAAEQPGVGGLIRGAWRGRFIFKQP